MAGNVPENNNLFNLAFNLYFNVPKKGNITWEEFCYLKFLKCRISFVGHEYDTLYQPKKDFFHPTLGGNADSVC